MHFPKIKNLLCFQEVVRAGSASQAAYILEMTQSAVSKNIAELEEFTGIQLFNREKNRLNPTSEAILLLDKVENILTNLSKFSHCVSDIENLKLGTLRLSAPAGFVDGPLVNILCDFIEAHGDVNIIIDSRSSQTVISQVTNNDADFGFVKIPVSHPELNILSLFTSGTACVVPKTNILSEKPRLSPADLLGQKLIILGQGRSFQLELKRAFFRAGIPMNVVLETHTVGASCAYASKNMGIAIVNEELGKTYVTDFVKLIPFTPEITHEYAMVSSKVREKSLISLAFQKHVRTLFT